jgi:hypothetical protein
MVDALKVQQECQSFFQLSTKGSINNLTHLWNRKPNRPVIYCKQVFNNRGSDEIVLNSGGSFFHVNRSFEEYLLEVLVVRRARNFDCYEEH